MSVENFLVNANKRNGNEFENHLIASPRQDSACVTAVLFRNAGYEVSVRQWYEDKSNPLNNGYREIPFWS